MQTVSVAILSMSMNEIDKTDLTKWLLDGDVSIQYQVHRDLLGHEKKQLRARIAKEGWGFRFLSHRKQSGHWGRSFYQPKWTSSHYTILDLKNLGISSKNKEIRQALSVIMKIPKSQDGGIHPIGTVKKSDVCVNGMFLNYATYFGIREEYLKSIVDFLIDEHMRDGGFNCYSNSHVGATHSSVHSTLSVAEGIREYLDNGYTYRRKDLRSIEREAQEFLLHHKLFRSHRTGQVMDKKMLMLSFPSRWRYDILRALDYFRLAGVRYDSRMDDAIQVLIKKRRANGRWPVQARHAGQTHFDMEKTGRPSRWNTLRALRVLDHFGIDF